ncbi:MAG TPA: DUF6162 family protein [Hydrogenophaga sp.]|nr:DUF6162 family protein [Hydrogenophaga sp.]
MAEQLVRPAGAGHETTWVALCALAIVLVAGAVIGVRSPPAETITVAAHQLDARDDLTAAEQGIYADLRLVAVELPGLHDRARPSVAELREAALPPFTTDIGSSGRGGHVWSAIQGQQADAYVGLSAAPEVAGSMLLRLSPHRKDESHSDEEPDIWLHRAAQPAWPNDLAPEALIAHGWKQVVSRFDAGVTRHKH